MLCGLATRPLEERQPVYDGIEVLVFSTVIIALLLLQPFAAETATVDDAKAAAAGIRKLPGKRLTLYTDLSGKEIDELPTLFEQAFPQWCQYFGRQESDLDDWHMTGFLVKDKARFVAAGLLPDNLPSFKHGFSRGRELWLFDQPSDYYRRHLLLHEGVHGFMYSVLGGCGPPWYMEGIAEYLATHRLHDGRLTLAYMPRHRDETPEWGRIRIIQDAAAERRALRLKQVVAFRAPQAKDENELYAWCWAAATLFDRHPRYRDRFRQLGALAAKEAEFDAQADQLFAADWQELCEEWQLLVANLEYGYDVKRAAVDFSPGKPLAGKKAEITIRADRGWQNSGLRLEAGATYRLTAGGRYQVAATPTVWWCEPNGVSIRYYQGRPLGILLAAVRPDHPLPDSTSALLRPTVVGLGTTLSPAEGGTLLLKINDSAAELADNAGQVHVEVQRQ
jgi:hypothetical protein